MYSKFQMIFLNFPILDIINSYYISSSANTKMKKGKQYENHPYNSHNISPSPSNPYIYPPYPYPPSYGHPYLYRPPPPNYPYPAHPQQFPIEKHKEQQKLSLSDKLNIIEELKYGDDWEEIKKQILQYQYDFDGYSEQKEPKKTNNPSFIPDNQKKNPHQQLRLKSEENKSPSKLKKNPVEQEKQRQQVKANSSGKTKSISYRLQIKGSKKTVNEDRLKDKYQESKNQFSDQGQESNNKNPKESDKNMRKSDIKCTLNKKKCQKLVNIGLLNTQQQSTLRYFERCPQVCKKCMISQHQIEYCPQTHLCVICLSHSHDSKVCPKKNLCSYCYKLGHKIDKCKAYQDGKIQYQYCNLCSRKHILKSEQSYFCFSLTKGSEQNHQVCTSQIKNWKQIRCMKCLKYGHLICKQQ